MLPALRKELDTMASRYEFPPRIDWDRIGTCKLEQEDETMVFCQCGCRPYCPCHQQLPDERDGLCGKGRHPFSDIPTDLFVTWHMKEGKWRPFVKRKIVANALRYESSAGRVDYQSWVQRVEWYPDYRDIAKEMVDEFIKEGGAIKSKETYELVKPLREAEHKPMVGERR